MSALNIGAPPSSANVLSQKSKWRVQFATVHDAQGIPLRIERTVLINLHTLEDLIDRHSRTLRVSGWEEMYYNLVMAHTDVRGVNPIRPTAWGRSTDQFKGRVDETKESKGELTNLVKLTFPPLPGDVLSSN
jgi:hypothetical protein